MRDGEYASPESRGSADIPGGIVNLGIVAHVDAGKTTLTEQLLFHGGALRSAGRVDDGTTQTDFLEIERRRGISVRAAMTPLVHRGLKINLIDTPGHVDFIAEVERVLRVLDAAVLVISAIDGIQAQTKVLWEALRALGTPTFVFINKTDRAGADPDAVLADLREQLSPDIRGIACSGEALTVDEALAEHLCERDEALLDAYLEGRLPPEAEVWRHAARAQTGARMLIPALCGSALAGRGVGVLLDALRLLAPRSGGDPAAALSGVVFRIGHEAQHGRIAYVRLYSGTLRNRDPVRNETRDAEQKVFQIRTVAGAKSLDAGAVTAGDIAAVYGLSEARVGDILGDPSAVPPGIALAAPLLRVRVSGQNADEERKLAAALEELSAEDPLLESYRDQRELSIHITGIIQLEVIAALLRERFGLVAEFGPPAVIYRETPSAVAEGFEAYTMPKPCWAVIRFLIEPLPRGSGVVYETAISNEKIHYRYQGQIRQTLPEALRQGPLGWEVTDLRVTLIDGGDHPIHTHPLDFVLATPLAMRDGLRRSGTTLLEPMLRVMITANEEHSGRIIGAFVQMRGTFDAPVIKNGLFTIEGRLPVAASLDFPTRLSSMTGGTAAMAARFDGYQDCPLELGATTPYRGIDPGDRAKYILWRRGAIQDSPRSP